MKKIAVLFVLFISLSISVFAQKTRITGKVTNNRNEALAGVTIRIGGAAVTRTDIEGRYTVSAEFGKKYTISFSYVGYAEKNINDVTLSRATEDEVLDVMLEEAGKALETVTVRSNARAGARGETVNAMIAFQKNTNTVASVVSAEAIRRSPDRNTGEVIKRTPGASLQEGKFLIIRGLADRYNQAMLNGILLTSTEPDRKTFSFDLIPAAMIDNVVINKAFVPELPGEWAGGLIQVNTKDIPTKSFFNIQLGVGYNTATTGKDFYTEKRGKLDWLGIDDGARNIPASFPTKYNFDILNAAQKTALGKTMDNRWVAEKINAGPNLNFQTNGGFVSTLFGKKLGGSLSINYLRTSNFYDNPNRLAIPNSAGGTDDEYNYNDKIYDQNTAVGALASLSLQINNLNKISLKSIANVNTMNRVLEREGINITSVNPYISGTEFTYRQNTFFTNQISGEHGLMASLKLKWYGSFTILDGYVPDQRRILFAKTNSADPYRLIISNTLSQSTGSRVYQSLSDYVYTGGGDLTYTMAKGHTIKAGYMIQVKDRFFDARLFSIYLPRDNDALRLQPAGQVFAASNFGDGAANSTLFAFDALKGSTFRYMANTILNAGYLQFDNELADKLRLVWGLRVENYDQLIGSVKKWDPRHTYSKVTDFLPGINATYKVNPKTNIRLSGSQTVIRPELRELASLNIYDFELNASVQGNPALKRTKVTNLDLRYELYPSSGETFSIGVFYKHFKDPIEAVFEPGIGGSSTFNYQNAEKATVYGVELEIRKRLASTGALKNFTIQGNFSYIKSAVADTALKIDRALQGQSGFLANAGLMYDSEEKGFNATLLFNQIGNRIATIGKREDGFWDTWERGRAVFDLQMGQKVFNKRGEFRLNISDILNQTRVFYLNPGVKSTYSAASNPYRFQRTFGTTFSLLFNYSIL